MGKLTKAGYARAKSELGLKGKLTRKQAQRVFKRAIKKLGRSSSKTGKRSKTKTTRKRRKNPMTRRRRGRRRGKNPTATLYKLVRLGALVAPGLFVAVGPGTARSKVMSAGRMYTGFDIRDGSFHAHDLLKGWGPFLGAVVLTYGIPKIGGIIRRI